MSLDDKLRERARNPNTPAEELKALARMFPDEVLSNPALPLVQLSDPALAKEIEEIALLVRAERRLMKAFDQASPRAAAEAALAAVTRALPAWEAVEPPGERQPHELLDLCRAALDGSAEAKKSLEARVIELELKPQSRPGGLVLRAAQFAGRAAFEALDRSISAQADAVFATDFAMAALARTPEEKLVERDAQAKLLAEAEAKFPRKTPRAPEFNLPPVQRPVIPPLPPAPKSADNLWLLASVALLGGLALAQLASRPKKKRRRR